MVLFWERKISCESHHPVVDLISSHHLCGWIDVSSIEADQTPDRVEWPLSGIVVSKWPRAQQ